MTDMWSTWRSFAIAAAIELDVFTRIAAGKVTAEEIAADADANAGAMRRLLDAQVGLKVLQRKGDRYSLTPAATTYLVRGSDLYMEGAGRMTQGLAMQFSQLSQVVRTGHALGEMGAANPGEFFAFLVKSIFPASYAGSKAAVASIPKAGRNRIKEILDVAAGAAPWSIAFAEAIPEARVTALDYAQVIPVTREYTDKYGVSSRYSFIEGDLRESDFGLERYDLVILGHIIHGEGRDGGIRLIEKSATALKKGGQLLIAEFIPNDERTGPALPLLFGLNMMIATQGADVFTMREYREWLKSAGFRTIKVIRTPAAPSPLILATK